MIKRTKTTSTTTAASTRIYISGSASRDLHFSGLAAPRMGGFLFALASDGRFKWWLEKAFLVLYCFVHRSSSSGRDNYCSPLGP
uniref:Uncharacterized protein n=1 Tax=Arundo donax TaxID=35708 RepID=A0A0A9F1Z0_ARUDO